MNYFYQRECPFVLLVLMMLVVTPLYAIDTSDTRTINVATAGKLGTLLPEAERQYVVNLTLTGKLNGTDFNILRSMATDQKLQTLDLKGANIVSGGASYYTNYGTNYYTKNNEFGYSLFNGCKKIQKIVLPNSLVTIGQCAFWYCSNLKTLVIGSKVTSIEPGLWGGCSKLTDIQLNSSSFHYVNGILYDKNYSIIIAAIQAQDYGDMTIRSGVKEIQYNAFAFCSKMTSLTFPSSVTKIGDTAFEYTGISSVSFTSAITSIGSFAFSGCKNLKEIDLTPLKITSLGYGLFMTSNIEIAYLPKTLKEMKQAVFYKAPLKHIFAYTATPATMYDLTTSSPTFENVDVENCTVHVPQGKVNTYKAAAGWKDFKYITDSQEIESLTDEAYAVYTDDGTLTFYYDKQKNSRSGTKYELNTGTNSPGWYTDHCQDIKKAVFTSSFANARPTSTYNWFAFDTHREASSLTDISGMQYLNTSAVTTMRNMFLESYLLTSLDVSHFDTSNVTDMWCMFYGCTSLTNLDVTNFNTNKVTNMGLMFHRCKSLKNLDVTKFNTANVDRMDAMFEYCSGLTTLDVTHFNTSKVTMMKAMFSGCSLLTTLDVSNFNTSEVEYMEAMFSGCSQLTSLDVSHFDTKNVTCMDGMFYGCSGLTSLDLSSFNTSKVTRMSHSYYKGMFEDCTNLKTIYVGDGWNTDNVTLSESMFLNCTNLVGGAGTVYDSNHVDKEYARIDGGVSNPGYLTRKDNGLPTTGCDEDWLQKKLDEIATQKPSEPVELTICEDGITLTKGIEIKEGCKAVLTGGPITVETNVLGEGLFMVYGEIGFRDIKLNFNNDAKGTGNIGYFWLRGGTLNLLEGSDVTTVDGSVVGGDGTLNVKDASITAGGNEMMFDSRIDATISGCVHIIGPKTYCNGSLTLEMTNDPNTGSPRFPWFMVDEISVTSSLNIWAPYSTLRSVYLYKDATINTETAGLVSLPIKGEWNQMTVGRSIVTSSSIVADDYRSMTFSGMPSNRLAEFMPAEHAVKLVACGVQSFQSRLDQVRNLGANNVVSVDAGVTNMLYESTNTQGIQNVTFDGMAGGSASRGRLHFEQDKTLTVVSGSTLTLTNLDIDGAGGADGIVVSGTLVLGGNVHVSDFTCFVQVQGSGRILATGSLTSPISIQFVNGAASGQVVVEGSGSYQLTEQDLAYVQVEGCELALDTANNRIVVVTGTGIETVSGSGKESAAEGIYDLNGNRVASLRHGVYIIRSKGNTRKVAIK